MNRLFLVALVAFAMCASSAFASIGVTDCYQAMETPNEEYVLLNNIVSAGGTCFNIANSSVIHDVIVDCQGYSVTSPDGDADSVIGFYSNEDFLINGLWARNFTLKNCVLNATNPFYFNGAEGIHLYNNTFFYEVFIYSVYPNTTGFANISFNSSDKGNFWGGNYNGSVSGYSYSCVADGGFCSPYDVYNSIDGLGNYIGTDYLPSGYVPVLQVRTVGMFIADVGSGLGAFISAISDPVVNFVLMLGLVGGVLSLFMAIGYVIKGALSR